MSDAQASPEHTWNSVNNALDNFPKYCVAACVAVCVAACNAACLQSVCSVLQCVAVCCSVLECVAECFG